MTIRNSTPYDECPHCGEYQYHSIDRFSYDLTLRGIIYLITGFPCEGEWETLRYECENCKYRSEE